MLLSGGLLVGSGSRPFVLNISTGNKNSIQEEIKSRFKLGNACYYSVQNLTSKGEGKSKSSP